MSKKIQRKVQIIDATGQSLGRLATKIAILLRGKHKPGFLPYVDGGDIVIVKNVDKLKITGKKIEQKVYWRHSGFPGGLKKEKMRDVILKKGKKEVLKRAVYGMLPKNKLRKRQIKRLKFKNG